MAASPAFCPRGTQTQRLGSDAPPDAVHAQAGSEAGAGEQDKRSVIAINPVDWDTLLNGPHEGAVELVDPRPSKTLQRSLG
jgi:hypothetical protein